MNEMDLVDGDVLADDRGFIFRLPDGLTVHNGAFEYDSEKAKDLNPQRIADLIAELNKYRIPPQFLCADAVNVSAWINEATTPEERTRRKGLGLGMVYTVGSKWFPRDVPVSIGVAKSDFGAVEVAVVGTIGIGEDGRRRIMRNTGDVLIYDESAPMPTGNTDRWDPRTVPPGPMTFTLNAPPEAECRLSTKPQRHPKYPNREMNSISRLTAMALAMGVAGIVDQAELERKLRAPDSLQPNYPQTPRDARDAEIAAKYREERLERKRANMEKRKPRKERT